MFKSNHLYTHDALSGLNQLSDGSIDMVLTSPPYWNLRNYGVTTEKIWGGKPGCKHLFNQTVTLKRKRTGHEQSHVGNNQKGLDGFNYTSRFCSKCGAWQGQLGLEPTVEGFIDHLMMIFDEVQRVLKPTGTCWVNLGDTYTKSSKSLSLVPFRFAQTMTEHGWLLRNVIIWHKPNAIPSSVKDRFTVDFEYLFFFAKSKYYYFNQQFEPLQESSLRRRQYPSNRPVDSPYRHHTNIDKMHLTSHVKGRNRRCVWTIANKRSNASHYATYPMDLCEIPILAGCPKEVCKQCGLPSTMNCGCDADYTVGVVLDPFMGSGTSAIAAKKIGCDYLGFEPNPDYVKIAEKRIVDVTHRKVQRIF